MIRVAPHAAGVLALLVLSGCATSRYCMGELPYQQAKTIPTLKGTADLTLPESQAALRVPPVLAEGQPYGRLVTDEDGDERALCLDSPPRLAELPKREDLPAEENPAADAETPAES